MVAVLTGDIVNSREGKVIDWLSKLKEVLGHYGSSPEQWEIFRGDSFQLLVDPNKALVAAIHIKAVVKQFNLYDVRIAIGLGEQTYKGQKLTESNGSAFIHSGETFDALKKQNLAIKTSNHDFDIPLNTMLKLAMLIANSWSPVVAEVIATLIEHPQTSQMGIAELLRKSQSSISEALKRGGYNEIMEINTYYQKQLAVL